MKTSLLIAILLLSCQPLLKGQTTEFPGQVEEALKCAGTNRPSLEQTLQHYQKTGKKEQYAAACYLISHMAGHSLGGRIIHYDPRIDSLIKAADAHYYQLIKGTTAQAQESDPLHKTIKDSARAAASRVGMIQFEEPEVDDREHTDIQALDGTFVRRQVDHAFTLRQRNRRLAAMPMTDFLDYVLPYRAIADYPLVTGAEDLSRIFSKYLQADTASNYVALVERYNRALWWLRHYQGPYPFDTLLGLPDLFFTGVHECADQAEYCARILRACGVPAAVEFNVAYRIWQSHHYMVVIPDGHGRWTPFNAENGIPVPGKNVYTSCLNIYRYHFAPTTNVPAVLRAQGEPLPEVLGNPYIEDVTSRYLKTFRLELPLSDSIPADHRLAYLSTFQSGAGLTEVTWGERSAKGNRFVFRTVVPDNVYFPTYCNGTRTSVPAGTPFCLYTDPSRPEGYRMEPLARPTGKTVRVILKRKYPVKPHLADLAARNLGTVVLGSDSLDFSHADTLAVITTPPTDQWTDLPIRATRPYRYYRVQAPRDYPHLHLAELQFLTRRKHGYKNVINPTPLDGGAPREDSEWQRLMDEPLDKCRWKAEYDGNVQTAPDRWPNVTLKLTEPQWVERLRFVAKNADNGIRPGLRYQLRKWSASGWTEVWEQRAATNVIAADNLEVGACYWLKCLDGGKEELPFIVEPDGTVRFPHDWVVRDVEAGKYNNP